MGTCGGGELPLSTPPLPTRTPRAWAPRVVVKRQPRQARRQVRQRQRRRDLDLACVVEHLGMLPCGASCAARPLSQSSGLRSGDTSSSAAWRQGRRCRNATTLHRTVNLLCTEHSHSMCVSHVGRRIMAVGYGWEYPLQDETCPRGLVTPPDAQAVPLCVVDTGLSCSTPRRLGHARQQCMFQEDSMWRLVTPPHCRVAAAKCSTAPPCCRAATHCTAQAVITVLLPADDCRSA